jgi:hypothetical protein
MDDSIGDVGANRLELAIDCLWWQLRHLERITQTTIARPDRSPSERHNDAR